MTSTRRTQKTLPASAQSTKLVDVDRDGNCFFRALYGAARDGGVLSQVAGCFQPSTIQNCWENIAAISTRERVRLNDGTVTHLTENPQENYFVKCARDHFAKIIRYNVSKVVKDTLKTFKNADIPFEVLMTDFEGWMVEAFYNSDNDPKKFNSFIAQHINKWGTWVSQLEVELIRHALAKCDIVLLPVISHISQAPPRVNANELQLLNDNGYHYKYVRYGPSKTRNND